MLQKLQTTLNPDYSIPQHRVQRPRIPSQVYKAQEFIFNASTTSDPGTPTSMQEQDRILEAISKGRNQKLLEIRIMGES